MKIALVRCSLLLAVALPGAVSLTVTFSGYHPATDSFTVSAGQTAAREINLTSAAAAPATAKDGTIQLAAFTVFTEREGNAKAVQAQRRNGMAPQRVSSRLGYAYQRFNGSLGGIFTAERPDGTYGRFREAVAQFDTSLNWKLTRRTTLYAQGRNFTGQPLKWFDTPPGVAERRQRLLRQYQEYGTNWNFGVKGTF